MIHMYIPLCGNHFSTYNCVLSLFWAINLEFVPHPKFPADGHFVISKRAGSWKGGYDDIGIQTSDLPWKCWTNGAMEPWSHGAQGRISGEGEVAFFSAKRWDRRNRVDLIESATPCHDAQVVGPYQDSNPLRLTVLAAMSEDYTKATQHLGSKDCGTLDRGENAQGTLMDGQNGLSRAVQAWMVKQLSGG